MNLRELLQEAGRDPAVRALSGSSLVSELAKRALAHGLSASAAEIQAELESLSDAELDQVAGGDGSYWGKLPNHSQGVSR